MHVYQEKSTRPPYTGTYHCRQRVQLESLPQESAANKWPDRIASIRTFTFHELCTTSRPEPPRGCRRLASGQACTSDYLNARHFVIGFAVRGGRSGY